MTTEFQFLPGLGYTLFRGGDDYPSAHLPIYGLEGLGFVSRELICLT